MKQSTVPNTSTQISYNNHTVQKAYLRQFSVSGQLYEHTIEHVSRTKPTHVNEATVLGGFYLLPTEGEGYSDAVEKWFSSIENEGISAIRVICKNPTMPVSEKAKTQISLWIALHFLRLPSTRWRLFESLKKKTTGSNTWDPEFGFTHGYHEPFGSDFIPKDGSASWCSKKRLEGTGRHLSYLNEHLADLAFILAIGHWRIGTCKTTQLVTSDNPFYLWFGDTGGEGLDPARSFKEAEGISFPLDPNTFLGISFRAKEDYRKLGTGDDATSLTRAEAGWLNTYTMLSAARVVYSKEQDTEINGILENIFISRARLIKSLAEESGNVFLSSLLSSAYSI